MEVQSDEQINKVFDCAFTHCGYISFHRGRLLFSQPRGRAAGGTRFIMCCFFRLNGISGRRRNGASLFSTIMLIPIFLLVMLLLAIRWLFHHWK